MTDKKILIIDGHPVYIHKLEGFLRGLTFQNILLSPSGQEALTVLEAEPPHLVILSGMLPDRDSLELCRDIRTKHPSVKIIVQIGLFTQIPKIEEFMSSGADAVLARKEKDLQPLQEAIQRLINNPSTSLSSYKQTN